MNIHFNTKNLFFEWDAGNVEKITSKHQVNTVEVEEVLQNIPLLLKYDNKHSENEVRYHILGATNSDRELFIVITSREGMIRVISARPMSKKEKEIFNLISKTHEKA